MSLVVPAGFGAVSAVTHLAPATAVIAAGIYEQPRAVVAVALLDSLEHTGAQQIRGVTDDRPEHSVERALPTAKAPLEAVAARYELEIRHRG